MITSDAKSTVPSVNSAPSSMRRRSDDRPPMSHFEEGVITCFIAAGVFVFALVLFVVFT